MHAAVHRDRLAACGAVEPLREPAMACDTNRAALSPAAALQLRLQEELLTGFPEPQVRKFAPATRLALLAGLTLGSWGVVIGAYHLLIGTFVHG